MSQPAKSKDDTEYSPVNHTLQPGPGGDTGSAKQSVIPVVPDAEDGTDNQKTPAADKQDNKEAPGAVKQKNLDQSIGAEGKVDETLDEEKGVLEAPVSEVQGTEESPDAGLSHDGSTAVQENASIQALLKRDLHQLTRPERSILYHEGVKRQKGGHVEGALKCYLGAITGLSEGSSFEELPKCLHAIADVYFEQKEYEKAVYFIQAEKMYYETALIDIVSIQKHDGSKPERRQSKDGEELEEQLNEEPGKESAQDKSDDPDDDLSSPDAKKGQEFENLARLCLKEGKLQLALDYCGKATKMYQTVYGEEHPITVAALDLFTVIYADVGKKLYSDAMEKFEKEEETLKSERSHDTMSPDSTAPELRQRFSYNNSKEMNVNESRTHEEMMHHGELEPTPTEERDDWVMTVLLMLIFFLATVFIVIVISSIYCYNNNRTGYCAQTRGDINYWYMYARHFIHDIRKKFR